ncbi:MAG TPA: xanthine dehydrogenase family protein subunit M [Phenylobacterium sp.]|uniref:FAD binding domain-containing protein n=1 Tax=Phenylobacterium sp. TaxID=1871053 RepID=UPI002C1CFCC4|nr:xanthine dehydrogenase family protein subunit M [Phenylobacterium sp.]HSV01785.1 xanthine dehydrogenase family protein subunit M [Phenylobacterium sp.]
MNGFDYHRPESLEAAVAARRAAADGAYLAGGMTLIPTLKQGLAEPSDLIDLGAIRGLAGIGLEADRLTIGAMTRHADVAASAEVQRAIPALAYLASEIGDAQVRNRGTLGGSLANSDPAADYPAAVIGLGASILTDRRTIAADDYFKGLFETALEPGELIRAVAFAVPRRAAYRKFRHPASRYAVAGVFVADTGDGFRVGVTGAGPCAFRWTALETALAGKPDAAAAGAAPLDSRRFNADLHASAEYRANLVRVMAARALADLAG